MWLDNVDYVNIFSLIITSKSNRYHSRYLVPHPPQPPLKLRLDFASVVAPGLTLRRSHTDWTWTLRLSSRWSTRLCVIDLIFLGSDYKNDSTLSLLSISTLTESRFTIIPRTFAFALILTYLLPTLTRLSTPLAVCDHFFIITSLLTTLFLQNSA